MLQFGGLCQRLGCVNSVIGCRLAGLEGSDGAAREGGGIDAFDLVGQIRPPALFLHDVSTTTLAQSPQTRACCAAANLAGRLAMQVSVVVVVPALTHELARLVLRLLFEALTKLDVANSIFVAVARARGLICNRSTGSQLVHLAHAADLVVWRQPFDSPGTACPKPWRGERKRGRKPLGRYDDGGLLVSLTTRICPRVPYVQQSSAA